jgi:hypothetical protein
MREILLIFVLMLCVLNCGSNAIAKEKKAGKNNPATTSKGKPDNLPLSPFDKSIEKLPPNFKGSDIVKLFSTLKKKAPLKKAEFETTADYEKKISAAVTDDVYAFKLASDAYGQPLKIQPYNADTQKLQIDIETTALSQYLFEGYRASMIIKDINGPSRSYIGSNAFGADVLVDSYSGTLYGIALVNQTDFATNNYNVRTINLLLDMPPEKAKSLKNNIGILLLCKPTLYRPNAKMTLCEGNDLVFEDTSYSGATIDNPTSLSYERKFINVEVLSIWVYETNTGSILFKKLLKNKEDN